MWIVLAIGPTQERVRCPVAAVLNNKLSPLLLLNQEMEQLAQPHHALLLVILVLVVEGGVQWIVLAIGPTQERALYLVAAVLNNSRL